MTNTIVYEEGGERVVLRTFDTLPKDSVALREPVAFTEYINGTDALGHDRWMPMAEGSFQRERLLVKAIGKLQKEVNHFYGRVHEVPVPVKIQTEGTSKG